MEQLIISETAKLAKEKGFGVLTLNSNMYYCFTHQGELFSQHVYSYEEISNESNTTTEKYTWIPAPSQALLQEWIRDVHHIHVGVQCWDAEWQFFLQNTMMCNTIMTENNIISYTDALELGLQEALRLIKK